MGSCISKGTEDTLLNGPSLVTKECGASGGLGIMSTEKNALLYNMNYAKRGQALIFNHGEFDSKKIANREGTDNDEQMLVECLTELNFTLNIYKDKTACEILSILEDMSKSKDHSDEDCILVFVLTHGSLGSLQARDITYNTDTLWSYFTADKCPTLASKPKLFFIQACQGGNYDLGVKMKTVTDSTDASPFKIPTEADILVMYSTPPGYVAYRNKTGSPFVKAFCKVLREESNSTDLLSMTTRINLQVADFESKNTEEEKHGNKQIPYVTSRLMRDVFFSTKSEKGSKEEKDDPEDVEGCLLEGTGDKVASSSSPVDTEGLKLTK